MGVLPETWSWSAILLSCWFIIQFVVPSQFHEVACHLIPRSLCKLMCITRTTPPKFIWLSTLAIFDNSVGVCFMECTAIDLSATCSAWKKATLSLSHGSLGILLHCSSAHMCHRPWWHQFTVLHWGNQHFKLLMKPFLHQSSISTTSTNAFCHRDLTHNFNLSIPLAVQHPGRPSTTAFYIFPTW